MASSSWDLVSGIGAETLAYLSADFFDELSLTLADILAYQICFENRTNFEEKTFSS